MKQRMHDIWKLLTINKRTLLLFEVLYRLVGIALVFPIVNQLFYLSIRLTGNAFIINDNLFAYLFRPSTIVVFVLIVFVFGLYVTFEVVALSALFHSSYYEESIGLQTLLVVAFGRLRKVFRKYHVTILMSSMVFLFIVEGLHVAGIASTIQLPTFILNELVAAGWIYPVIGILLLILMVLFIETIYYEIQCTIENTSFRENISHSRQLLHGHRAKMVGEFLIVNGVLNGILYVLYAIVVGIVALVVLWIRDDAAVFGIMLSFLYSIYIVIGFIGTIILIPVNFAWINSHYYEKKRTPDRVTVQEVRRIKRHKPLSTRLFQRVLLFVTLSLLVVIFVMFRFGSSSPTRIAFLSNPSIVAHRGGGNFAPENTIAAIETGIDLGADAVEIDVRFTSDGVPILMHDETTGRTTNDALNRKVAEMTLAEIKQLDAGSWYAAAFFNEPVPTLEEALATIDRRVDVYIELKAGITDLADVLVPIIERTNMQRHVKILSFNGLLLEEIKADNASIDTVLLLRNYVGDVQLLASYDYIDYIGFHRSIVDGNIDIIRELKEAGKGVYVWTVDDEDLIARLSTVGVDGIITGTPRVTREIVYSDTTRSVFRNLLEQIFRRNR